MRILKALKLQLKTLTTYLVGMVMIFLDLLKTIYRRLFNTLEAKFYNLLKKRLLLCSIDEISIYDWNKITKEKEYKRLCKWYVFSDWLLIKHFEDIYCEFIDFVGISHEYREYLSKRIELEMLECDYALTGDRYYLTFIELKRRELEALNKEEKKQVVSVKAYVEKYLGFKINEKQTSVREFYEYLKNMEIELKNGK